MEKSHFFAIFQGPKKPHFWPFFDPKIKKIDFLTTLSRKTDFSTFDMKF